MRARTCRGRGGAFRRGRWWKNNHSACGFHHRLLSDVSPGLAGERGLCRADGGHRNGDEDSELMIVGCGAAKTVVLAWARRDTWRPFSRAHFRGVAVDRSESCARTPSPGGTWPRRAVQERADPLLPACCARKALRADRKPGRLSLDTTAGMVDRMEEFTVSPSELSSTCVRGRLARPPGWTNLLKACRICACIHSAHRHDALGGLMGMD